MNVRPGYARKGFSRKVCDTVIVIHVVDFPQIQRQYQQPQQIRQYQPQYQPQQVSVKS